MTPASSPRDAAEVARRGAEIFERRVRPLLAPGDDGKFVVVDVGTEDYEISANEWDAIERLTERHRGAALWVTRVGKPYRMSFRTRFGA